MRASIGVSSIAAAIGYFAFAVAISPIPADQQDEVVPLLLCGGWAAALVGIAGALLVAGKRLRVQRRPPRP